MDNRKLIHFFGRLGKNPELKYTQKQEPICFLSIAETLPNSDRPIWHQVVVWGKQAETCSVFLKKGGSVFIRGHQIERDLKNENGDVKKIKEIKAESVGIVLI
jgi:single-strand DNA-binding protein